MSFVLPSAWLLAQESESARTFIELSRVARMTEGWQWILLAAACIGIGALVVYMYRRDCVELSAGKALALMTLRLLAFVGLLIFFLGVEKRTERKLVRNSRVLLLADTSISMSLRDDGDDATSDASSPRRIDYVTRELEQGGWLDTLREKHDVVLYRFDQNARPTELASYAKFTAADDPEHASRQISAALADSMSEMRIMAIVAASFFGVALLAGAVHLFGGALFRGAENQSWGLLVFIVAIIFGAVFLAVGNLRNPEVGLLAPLGLADPPALKDDETAAGGEAEEKTPVKIDWSQALNPNGTQTRFGDAVRFLAQRERGGPIAGMIVMTDGVSNAGVSLSVAIETAREAGIPIYTVGIGSTEQPKNVRMAEIEAPARVYPGDKFTIKGFVQAFGFDGMNAKVELMAVADSSSESGGGGVETLIDEQRIRLGRDGAELPVEFELAPDAPGRRVYLLRVVPPSGDRNPRDNQRTARVEVVDRQTKVLILAGGPTREYQFVRNMLFRDRDTKVDVVLQSAEPGVSQESDDILDHFPNTSDELFEYDCLIAFDPNWSQLDPIQAGLLERWVAEKAGGMIVVSGPVFTPSWSAARRGDRVLDTIKALYPVVFYTQTSGAGRFGRYDNESAWPIEFSNQGREADFLWLGDSAGASEEAWGDFEGVYSYFPVREAKPGATVYGRFSDPNTAIDNQQPIYLAAQYYGAGRVFYIGSGEMWRVRAIDDELFQQFYTKVVRHVAQGRLLRDSSRGVMVVSKERCFLGDVIDVRTTLNDAQFAPLKADSVDAVLVAPDGSSRILKLTPSVDESRGGTFVGQFVAAMEGDYRVELLVPQSPNNEILTGNVAVGIPRQEVEKPQMDEVALRDMASRTGGEYRPGMAAALGRLGSAPVANIILPQDHETYLPGTPDKPFQQLLMTWLLVFICGCLSLEWIIRRLNRLA